MNDVVGSIAGVDVGVGFLRVVIKLSQIGHAGALSKRPYCTLHDSNTKQHKPLAGAAELRTCRRFAVGKGHGGCLGEGEKWREFWVLISSREMKRQKL
nr:hypothetical protein Itr_chr15CG14870 [Ipomoea trifida]